MKKIKINRGFSLVELIIIVVIIGLLSTVAYVGIQSSQRKGKNERGLDDRIAFANAFEAYKLDHFGEYPDIREQLNGNQNILCFDAQAQYVHDCFSPEVAFIQGVVDNDLLTKRYLPEVPVDPWTGSRYVYGRSADGQYYQVAGLWQNDDGTFEARTQDNLAKGFALPSIIRAYDGPNFVVQRGEFLPYNPDALVLTARAQNVTGTVSAAEPTGTPETITNGALLTQGMTVTTDADSRTDLYFSDGSVTSLEPNTTLELKEMTVAENDKDNLITRITSKLLSGKLWNKVVRLSATSEFNIETTSAIAGVRGTEFGVELNAAGVTQVLVRSGSLEITNLAAPGVAPVVLDNGAGAEVTPITWRKADITSGVPADAADVLAGDSERDNTEDTFYNELHLNNSLVPRLLGVAAGVIRVENLYTALGLDPLTANIPPRRHEFRFLLEHSEGSLPFIPDQDDHHDGENYSLDIPAFLGGPAGTVYQEVRFQFQELDSTGAVIYQSAWSSPSLQISEGTALSEEEIRRFIPGIGLEADPDTAPQVEFFSESGNTLIPWDATLGPSSVQVTLSNYDFVPGGPFPAFAFSGCGTGTGEITERSGLLDYNAILTDLDDDFERCGPLGITVTLPDGRRLSASSTLDIYRSQSPAEEGEADARTEASYSPSLADFGYRVEGNTLELQWELNMQGHPFTGLRILNEDGDELELTDEGGDELTITEATREGNVDIPTSGLERGEENTLRFVLDYTRSAAAEIGAGEERTLEFTQSLVIGRPTILRIGFVDPATGTEYTESPEITPGGAGLTLQVNVIRTNEDDLPGVLNVTDICGWEESDNPALVTDGVFAVPAGFAETESRIICLMPAGTQVTLDSRTYDFARGLSARRAEMRVEVVAGGVAGPIPVTLEEVCSAGTGRTWIAAGVQTGCWVLADAGDSCDTACTEELTQADDLATADVDETFGGGRCSDDTYADGTGWNDDAVCSVCDALTAAAVTSCIDDPVNTAPFRFGSGFCRYRSTDAFPTQDCGATPVPATRRRICKCE